VIGAGRFPERAPRLALMALSPVGRLLAAVPARLGLWLGRRLGDLAWLLLPRRRRVALDNLHLAFPDRAPAERRRIAHASFRHLGMMGVEACVFAFRPPVVLLSRVEISGWERAEEAAAGGHGVLMLTAHLGNWELLAASHRLRSLPLSVVVRSMDTPALEAIVNAFRRRAGVELIDKRDGFRAALAALRRGRMVGVLLDQNAARAEGVFAPFFGVPASTSRGMALLALRSEAPVLPAFIRRLPGGRHLVEVGSVLPVPPGRDVAALTRTYTAAIESAIRVSPEQWLWVHRRWRTRPEGEQR
jgi:KDO2-lipid IV(A) lauroyltransferase